MGEAVLEARIFLSPSLGPGGFPFFSLGAWAALSCRCAGTIAQTGMAPPLALSGCHRPIPCAVTPTPLTLLAYCTVLSGLHATSSQSI